SQSITTTLMTRRLRAEGRRFPGQWAVDNRGEPTDDPGALFTDPPGALLPMGGTDHGHKGYALGLLVEALTGGPAGTRAGQPGGGVGRDGVPAGARPGPVRRQRRLPAADVAAISPLPRDAAPARLRARAPAGRERAAPARGAARERRRASRRRGAGAPTMGRE